MRLIYAEDLIQDSEDVLTWEMLARINRAETIEAEPVRHGHWTDDDRCSMCGFRVTQKTRYFCPNCGAKMDEVSG